MQKLTTTFLLLLCTFMVTAQSGWQWGKRGGAPTNGPPGRGWSEGEVEMVTDKNGNLYVLANISKTDLTANIDGFVHPTLRKAQRSLSKWDCNGNLIWTKLFGGPGNFWAISSSLAIDTLGGIYFTGSLSTLDASSVGGHGIYFDTDTTVDISPKLWYIVKYDTAGNFKWLHMPQADTVTTGIGGSGTANRSGAFGLDAAPNGDIYLLAHLAPGIFSGSYISTANSFHMMKYDKDGNFISATPFDITVSMGPYGPELSNLGSQTFGFSRDHRSGRFYMTGDYFIDYGTLTFGSTTLNSARVPGTSILNTPAYVTAFDNAGNNLWTKQTLAAADRGVNFLYSRPRIDEFGNIYISGGALPGDTFFNHAITNPIASGMAFFIISADSSGNLRWAKNSGWDPGAGADFGVITYNNGVVSAGGPWANKIFWNADTLTSPPNQAYNHIVQFNAHTGSVLNIDTFRFTGTGFHNTDIIGDNRGNLYVGGAFKSQIFLPSVTLTSMGGTFDWYVAKYGSSDCNCILPTPDFSVSVTGSAGISCAYTGSMPVDSVRWEFGDGAIASGLTAGHTYASSGSYGISIVVYSPCGMQVFYKEVTTGGTSISIPDLGISVIAYPNPAHERITIEGAGTGTSMELYNSIGQRVLAGMITQDKQSFDISGIRSGIYIISFTARDGKRGSVKMMKE